MYFVRLWILCCSAPIRPPTSPRRQIEAVVLRGKLPNRAALDALLAEAEASTTLRSEAS